jgi:hypothetical protein
MGETGQAVSFGWIMIWMRDLDAGQASLGQPGDDLIGDPRVA